MKLIYLEPDEEISSVIEKISNVSDFKLAIVVPKNSTLFQSLVNLKLLAKEAQRLGKEVAVISKDKIGQRLAKQVGVPVYSSTVMNEAGEPKPAEPVTAITAEALPDGTPVHRYVGPTNQAASEDQPTSLPATPEPSELPLDSALSKPAQPNPVPVNEPVKAAEEAVTNPFSEPGTAKSEVAPVDHDAEPMTFDDKADDQPVSPADEPKTDSSEAELPPIVPRHGPVTFNRPHQPLIIPWKSVAAAGVIVLLALIVLYLFLPRATITLAFPAKPLNQDLTLNVRTVPDQNETTIAGNQLSVDKTASQTITATGKKDIGTKATGTISITNRYKDANGVGKDESFPAGVIATDSKTKKTFALASATTVGRVTYDPNSGQPIYQTKTVNVTATDPGDSFNLPPSSFTIAGQLDNTDVSSTTAFTGGSSKQVTVLSQTDVDTAVTAMKTQTANDALAELKTKADKQTLLDGSVQQTIKSQSVDHAVGDQVDSANASLTSTAVAIVFDAEAAKAKVITALSKDLTDQQQLEIPPDKPPSFTYKSVNADITTMVIEAIGTGYAVPKIDKVQISKLARNKSVSAVQKLLADRYQAQSVQVTLRPNWWFKRLPTLYQAISVEYGFNATGP